MTMLPVACAMRAPGLMAIFRTALKSALMLASALTSLSVQAETLEQALVRRFPAGSIASVAVAREALASVDPARREAEQTFAAERARCYDKFFTSSCLSEVKDTRRLVLSSIRKVEVEANAFLRREKAAERDRVIAERQGRAGRPLDGPSIPITGAARDSGTATDQADQPGQPEKP